MIKPAYLRERAAYYRDLAESDEMRAHRDGLQALAQAFEHDAAKRERQSSEASEQKRQGD